MSEATTKLVTFDELAERWQLTPRQLKDAIRARKIPYVDFVRSGVRIKWSCVRFRIEDIERYETQNRSTVPSPPGESVAAITPTQPPTKRRGRPSLLWS